MKKVKKKLFYAGIFMRPQARPCEDLWSEPFTCESFMPQRGTITILFNISCGYTHSKLPVRGSFWCDSSWL